MNDDDDDVFSGVAVVTVVVMMMMISWWKNPVTTAKPNHFKLMCSMVASMPINNDADPDVVDVSFDELQDKDYESQD